MKYVRHGFQRNFIMVKHQNMKNNNKAMVQNHALFWC
jgi:hypothetical protein